MPASARRSAVLATIFATVLALSATACGEATTSTPSVVPSDVHLASSAPPGPSSLPDSGGAGAERLEAARTVELYCRLVDRGQFARAASMCSRPDLWSRRELESLRAFRFRSARVFAAPDARTLVLLTRVRVHARRSCPLPDGLATLFFTLGRVGTTVGRWLITAVTTSP